MQNLVNEAPAKKNYKFIDSIRAIAMISIVVEHCFSFDESTYHPTDKLSILTFVSVIQFIKFGTIAFFLLSGFLIGEKFTTYTPYQYLKRRVDNTIAPWVFWSLFFLAMKVLNDAVIAYKFNSGVFQPHFGLTVLDYAKNIYLYTSYWFIPNFLICIGILLIFKRWLYSYWLGATLFLFTILYMFNIYNEWIEPRHSTAIFGFVFFLWLGALFNRHLSTLEKWVDKTSIWLWIALSTVTLVSGIWEIQHLKTLHSVDPYNTLRLSNILYSLCFFFLLIKIKNFGFAKYLKSRETTYGIYLIHYILVAMLLPIIFVSLRFDINPLSYGEVWLYMLTRLIIVYSLTFIIVTLLNKTKAKVLIGR
ncbi:acyltransferase [Mucilaginibacter sp.]|uniref:acyltransferase family protein n=1 Tax=Mucilaginibacter sp. TaxID=1882438 RepID=UPI002601D6F7|nr:acyltransferase [Mucilaginibacter sp.]MDB4924349.1 Membrane-bound acyltransferase YfiQ, involved in biofilm formation [Mucilaginibacter sp.]